jgi:Zn-dependent peptidase ImmA (M78 family)
VGVAGLPIDVQVIAGRLNIKIVEESIDGPGYLLALGRLGTEIIVRSDDAIERKRFTIAHELGHWVLGVTCESRTGMFQQPAAVRREKIERWCDVFAASLLMPRHAVMEYFCGVDDSFLVVHLLHAPTHFKVSEEAMFLRVNEILAIRVAYLHPDSLLIERISHAFVPEAAANDIKKVLSLPRIQELLRLDVFASYVELAGTRFLCAWQRKVRPRRVVFILRPAPA